MNYSEATKLIAKLLAKKNKGSATDDDLTKLAALQEEFPKKGSRGRGKEKPGNDIAFWNRFPDLLKDASNIPFNFIPGTVFRMGGLDINLNNVCLVEFMPAPGVGDSATTAFNTWARSLYLELHRKYRGLGSYTWSDLGIAIFAILDVFGRVSEYERVYGILNEYPVNSRIQPRGLLRAMGYSVNLINSIKANMSDYRYGINRIITKMKQLCLPKGMGYLYNRIAQNGFVYADSKDKRASYYVYLQSHKWTYSATASSKGSCVIGSTTARTTASSYTQYLDDLESDVDILLADTDIARICSDLLAAFGDGGVTMLNIMPDNYTCPAIYDESILNKIHNLETLGLYNPMGQPFVFGCDLKDDTLHTYCSGSSKFLAIGQSDEVIYFLPHTTVLQGMPTWAQTVANGQWNFGNIVTGGSSANNQNVLLPRESHYLDTWENEPSQAIIVEGIMHKNVGESVGRAIVNQPNDTLYSQKVLTCGTEIITKVAYRLVVQGNILGGFSRQLQTCVDISGFTASQVFKDTAAFSKLDWSPLEFSVASSAISHGQSGNVITAVEDLVGDVDNFTPITFDTIARVHDAALLSAFVFDGQSALVGNK